MRQLTGHDASFLYAENPHQPMQIGSLIIYDPSTAPGGRVRFEELMGHIESRLDAAEIFRKRLAWVPLNLDHPWWVDDADFDIEYHIRHIALPEPGDWRQLCIQVARLHARPLDHGRPLWEFTVVEGLDAVAGLPEGSFAIVSKVHHACVDGVSGDQLNTAIHDLTPDLTPDPGPAGEQRPWTPDAPPRSSDLLARAWARNTREPFRFARLLARTVPALGRGAQVSRRLSTPPVTAGGAPRTRFNGTIGPHRVFDSVEIGLDSVKRIRQAVPGSTVNDVLLAVVGGAMRRYLDREGELPDRTLTAMAPISARPRGGSGDGGNRVSAMFVPLGTDVADPVDRLQAVHEGTQASKALTDAVGADLLADYAQFTPSMLAGVGARLASSLGMANRVDPAYNTVVSNVPGPQQPLYLCGARVVAMHGLAPIHDGVGLFHGAYSYCGRVFVSATACRDLLPDPEVYAEDLRAAHRELEQAADVGVPAS